MRCIASIQPMMCCLSVFDYITGLKGRYHIGERHKMQWRSNHSPLSLSAVARSELLAFFSHIGDTINFVCVSRGEGISVAKNHRGEPLHH